MSRRRRALFWSTLVLALAAVVTGAVVAYQGYRQTTTAAGVVRAYFTALVRSDADSALGFSVSPDGDRRFLTSEVLGQQQRLAPITNVRVNSIHTASGRGTVAVTYRLHLPTGTRSVSDVVQVRHTGDGWRVGAPAVPLSTSSDGSGSYVRFVGYALPSEPVLVFPGALPVSFATPYLQPDASTSWIRLSDVGGLSVQTSLSAAGQSAFTTAIKSLVQSCVNAKADSICPVVSTVMVPGTLRSGHVGDVRNVSVSFTSGGLAHVTASVTLNGASYEELDVNNQPVTRTEDVELDVAAEGYPVAPLHLQWEVSA